jgi:hypothetical protein
MCVARGGESPWTRSTWPGCRRDCIMRLPRRLRRRPKLGAGEPRESSVPDDANDNGHSEQSRATRWTQFLAKPSWTGVGALATVVSVLVAVAVVLITSVSHSTDASPASSGSLGITSQWPESAGCPSASVAVFPNGPQPSLVKASMLTNELAHLAAKGGAAFDSGDLTLTFTVAGNAVAQIVNLRPIIYRVGARKPAWIDYSPGQCGGTYGRIFALDLDDRTLTDEGVVKFGSASSSAPTSPIGSGFHVSQSDPAQIQVIATGCSGYYEWGVQVSYVIGTHQFVRLVGTPENPFRVVSALGQSLPLYWPLSAGSKLSRIGTVEPGAGCQGTLHFTAGPF